MKKIAFLIATSIMVLSCVSKNDKIIAIDVLLTPSEAMQAQSLQLNTLINRNNPETIKLDENHIPHITLLQCFIKEKDLPKVNKAVEGLFETIKNDTIYTESLYYSSDTEESFAMIRHSRTESIVNLHKKTIDLVKPYIVKGGSQESFVQNPDGSEISEFTVDYVPDFVEKYSYENFDPHISLGVAQRVLLDSLYETVFKPIPFLPASLAVYQLGDHGTAQKLLWTSE